MPKRERLNSKQYKLLGPPGVWGIWGEWLFIFREQGGTGNYFQGFREQAHSFGDLEIPAKKFKKSHLKGKAFILFDFLKKKSSASGGKPHRPPLDNLNVFHFLLT